MAAWRRTPVRERPIAWLIQETHVATAKEAMELQAEWRRLWGRQHRHHEQELSYWSVDDSKTGGVAILLNPSEVGRATPWKPEKWTKRLLTVQLPHLTLINVYAPTHHGAREAFYSELIAKDWPEGDLVFAGDFNCVQSPGLDRMGERSSGRPESAALQDLTQSLGLEDALTLAIATEEEDEEDSEPLHHFTYWGPDTASRLDRFYLPTSWTSKVHWLEVTEPAASSDHQRVRLHYRDTGAQQRTRHRKRPVQYPIRTAQPGRVQAELQAELADAKVGSHTTTANWDATAKLCRECIGRIEKRETQRRNAAIHRLNAQNRAHLFTRNELLEATAIDLREEHLIRLGQRLERTTEQIRWNFKRISNWERDQSIAEIQQLHGAPFTRKMELSDCFASEWKEIFGTIHNAYSGKQLEDEFDHFVSIPRERQLSDDQNKVLMESITTEEVIQAIKALRRHKAAGSDELNNDFFKDQQALLVDAMVAIGNELLKGGEPPRSFLDALILPLRKQGDSADARNFRPISLLQTGYKVFTKVLATRAQRVMGTPIGESQQGFVHGRQMMKTIMMMMAMLSSARSQQDQEADLSRIILTLDFKKAYDTVAREFLFLALRKFGFAAGFVEMIERLHEGTTARFLVNGELSQLQDVVSGIRQGCPLAPLLFILAAEILALAIKQDSTINGIEVPNGDGQRHAFSAFVDDSTVFLQEARQLPRVMEIVENFGKLSGLHVQPAKSHVIFLNTTIKMTTYEDIPVLQQGDTIRYLGHAVGTGQLTDVNWEQRIRKVQRRLATAAQLATSMENRVQILNVIMLPAVLFTAAVFDMPTWAGNQLRNLQKQFLWNHATSTDAARHKINPGLLYCPKQAGGAGLVSIEIASKTQKVKQTMLWLIQRRDAYFLAWKTWAWRGMKEEQFAGLTPRAPSKRNEGRRVTSPGDRLQRLVGEWIAPTRDTEQSGPQPEQRSMEEDAISWATAAEWTIQLPCMEYKGVWRGRSVDDNFWPTYTWESNPTIRDAEGNMLTRSKYNRIRACRLDELQIRRTAVDTYKMVIPTKDGKMHRQDKMRRWGLAILLGSPELEIGEQLAVQARLQLRHPTALSANYKWTVTATGRVRGVREEDGAGENQTITLDQQSDGIHWRVVEMTEADEQTQNDSKRMSRHDEAGSIVFYAHPRIHGFPWFVPESIANAHVLKALKRQPFKAFRGDGPSAEAKLRQLQSLATASNWQAAALQQQPKQLWSHDRALTAYQVWVNYRVATCQLNLFHEGRRADNSCRRLQCCSGSKETLEHIFWKCPVAIACWQKLVGHWMEERWSEQQLDGIIRHCAGRQAPHLSAVTERRLKEDYPDAEAQLIKQWKRLWHILSSVCITTLWMHRNRVIFQQEELTQAQSVQEYWTTGITQIQALGKRERRHADTELQGTWLLLCCAALEEPPREQSSRKMSLAQPPTPQGKSALLARLRIYQASRS